MGKEKDLKTQGRSAAEDGRIRFIKQMFSRYYSEVKVPPPSRVEQREFGVITERAGMWRHLGFPTEADMRSFLGKQVPLHAYHSSTYYEKPNARTMDEKRWLGADLVFDLDADHIEGTEGMAIAEMLDAVKVQFTKLLDSFLLDDFGFGESDIKIVFSGGRGYHAHVSAEKVLKLDSHERREIVDYITYPNPDTEKLLKREPWPGSSFQGHVKNKYIYRLYPPDTPGWKGKVTRSVFDFIDKTESMTKEMVIAELTGFHGIGDKLAVDIYRSLFVGEKGNRGLDKIRDDLNLEQFSDDSVRNSFIKHILGKKTVDMGGETDEPVTSDIKRLIRLPESLHGKTGLVVRRLKIEDYRNFIPLDDAVWKGFGEGSVRICPREDASVKLAGDEFSIKQDAETELPAYAATFFACQKKCDILI